MSVDIQTIGFGADVSGLKSAQRELDNTSRSANKAADGADHLGNRFSALSSVTSMLKGVLAGVGLMALGKQFIEVADAVAMMEARLKLATGNIEDFAQAQKDVYRISQATQVGMKETATLYTRLADPVRRLGGGVRETAAMVEAFGQTLRISGASSAEASAATLQFSQAMAAGALRGDEFNSIAETSPRLLKVVAEALGTNAGALREMAADGKLTADVIGNALIGSLDQLRAEAETLPNTVGGVMTQLANLTQTLVGEFDKASGASGGMAEILRTILVPALKVAYTAVASLYGVLQSTAHIWVGVLSAASLAMQREFKLALTMLKQIPVDIERTATDTAASIKRVWGLTLEVAEEATGATRTLKGAVTQTGDEAKKAAKALEKQLRLQEELSKFVDKVDLEDRLRAARLNNEAFDLEEKRLDDLREATEGRIRSAREMAEAIEFEARALQMTNTEREIAVAMLQLERAGVVAGTEAYAAYAERIRQAIVDRDTIRRSIEQTKRIESEWAAASNRIGQSLSNALMNGGRSAWDYIKGLFRSGLAVPIQAFATSVMGSAGNAFTSMVGGGSGGSSALGTAGNALGMMGSLGTLGSFAATGFMNTIAGTGMMSGLGAAGSLMSGGSIMGGLGMGLGAVAPYLLAAVALYSLLSKGGETRSGGGYGYSAGGMSFGQGMTGIWSDEIAGSISAGQTRFLGGPSGGEIGAVRESVAATVAGINDLFGRLGSTERIDQFWGKLERSTKGRGGVFAGGTLASGASFGEASWESATSRTLTAEEAVKAFALDLKQSTIQALQAASDTPAALRDALSGVDAEALTDDQANAVLSTVEAFIQLRGAAEMLAVPVESLTTAMIQAGGGAESLAGAFAAYYQVTRSDEEKLADLRSQTAASFEALGFALPATVAAYRELVEGLDLTTEAGQSAYGALLRFAPAIQQLDRDVEAATLEIVDMGEAVRTAAAAVAAAREGYVDALQAVRDYVANAQAAVAASEATIASIRQAAQSEYQQTSARLVAAQQAVAAAQQRVADVARQAAERMRNLSQSLGDYLGTLNAGAGGIASPQAQLAYLRAQLQSTGAAAMGGDAEAAGRLTTIARDLMRASEALSPDAATYAADELEIRRILATVQAAMGARGADVPGGAEQTPTDALARALADLQAAQIAQTDAARVLSAVGAEVLTGSRDLAAEYAAAVAQLDLDMSAYNAALAATAELNFAMLDNQRTLADLLADLAIAAAKLSAAQSDTPTSAMQRQSINALYQQILGRDMEAGAFETYWSQRLASGVSLDVLAEEIRNSEEARALRISGSHADGLDYVPRNGYIAQLHRGERVLTAREARAQDGLVDELRQMRAEMRAGLAAIASHTDRMRKLEEKWDVDGLPAERTA